MKTNILLVMALVMVLFSMTFASASIGNYKQYSNIEIIQTCDNGQTMCDSCTISSIKAPNSTVLISDVTMTMRTADFYYNFNDTASFGTYHVSGYCVAGTEMKQWVITFVVTPSDPAENNSLFFFIFLGISLILLILAFVFKNTIFSFISGLCFLATGVYSMIYGFGNLTSQYTQIISYVIIGIGAIITIASAWDYINENYGGNESEEED